MPRVQLVLGSGGVRCYSYVGAIQELEERGYEFSSVSGVSAGALVGVLVAAGLRGEEIGRRLLDFDSSRLPRKHFLHDLRRLRWPYCTYARSVPSDLLLSLLEGRDPALGELERPFASVGLDLMTQRLFIYSSRTEPDMRVSEVVSIATAAPGVFPPHESGGRLLVDGVMASECPLWLAGAHDSVDPVLALRTRENVSWTGPKNVRDYFRRAVKTGIRGGDAAMAGAFGNSAEVTLEVSVTDREEDFAISSERRRLLIDEGRQQLRDHLEHAGLEFAPASPGAETSADSADAVRRFLPLAAPRDTVFLSYSRRDGSVREELMAALEQSLHLPSIRLWTDKQIDAGSDWQRQILKAMHRTRVAVLLVSEAYLESEFIRGEEEPFFLKAGQAEVLTVLWVNVDVRDRELIPAELRRLQAINEARPLPPPGDAARQAVWQALAERIQEAFLRAR